jgi:hypothetical protein
VQSHGGRLRNGQDITTMAQAANTWGQYTRKDCGSNTVTKIPTSYKNYVKEAKGKRHQSAICFIEPEAEAVWYCILPNRQSRFGRDDTRRIQMGRFTTVQYEQQHGCRLANTGR